MTTLSADLVHVDRVMQEFVAAHCPGWAAIVSRALMSLGTTWWGLAGCLMAAVLVVFALRAWKPAAAATVALMVGTMAATLGKALIQRPRPPEVWALVHLGGWSFPSTLATQTAAITVAFLLAGSFTSRTRRLLTVVGTVTVLLIGVAMVCLGAHWPTDVVVGWTLGAVIGAFIAAAARRFPTARRTDTAPSRTPTRPV